MADSAEAIIDWSTIPVRQKWWFQALLLLVIFPIGVLVILIVPAYQKKRGKVERIGKGAKILLLVLCALAWAFYLARLPDASAQTLPAAKPAKIVERQEWFAYKYRDQDGKDASLNLEVTVFEPKTWNGKIVVMNHGSTGDNPAAIKVTVKFVAINQILPVKGYRVFVLMRKARGKSEGVFTEEMVRTCDYMSQMIEVAEAEPQVDQFVDFLRARYHVDKVIMMGHSRGGYLTSYYSMRHPEKIDYAVNMNGGWSTSCEYKSRQTYSTLKESSQKFKRQIWLYANHDKYFSESVLSGFSDLATSAGIPFRLFETPAGKEGHSEVWSHPEYWLNQFLELAAAK